MTELGQPRPSAQQATKDSAAGDPSLLVEEAKLALSAVAAGIVAPVAAAVPLLLLVRLITLCRLQEHGCHEPAS